ncbi:type IV pilus assembly protein PilM [Tepidibacter hydrothermalis]|uniref:Type IV pilus assembly protein PilM n=1 Tax=Tepidibacter hydrothermalis TaxID=3036126 RepID=A0ABY8EDQ4_9FIRM|nr:type IV pilus assembly protein PilM [Tepidibacter hydrothermalis]WFD11042.1 type IV pilus assembly protein PilM [Tepidibacter hydrothermalis]
MFNNKVLSIDIGNKNIKIVLGKQNKNNVSVEKAIVIETPPNSYRDGNVWDIQGLKSVINKYIKSEKIKTKKTICTVQSTSIINREIKLPLAKKEEEMNTMVRFEIEQYLPIMFDDYVIEYKILETFIEEGIKKGRITVAALPKTIAEDYLKLIKELSLTPVALDMNSNAVSKLYESKVTINDENSSLDKTVAVIDIGHTQMNLNMISNGVVEFSRVIPVGSNEIDTNIANMLNVSLEEAEKRKIENSNLNHEKGLISLEMLNDIVKDTVNNYMEEIRRIFRYYKNIKRENTIDEIYLHGAGSEIKGLEDYLKKELDISVVKIEKMSNVKLGKETQDIKLNQYLNCIGSIIRK